MIKPAPTKHIHCSDCPIRHRAVCSYADRDELDRLNAIKYYKTYPPGSEVVAAGEESTAIGSVVEGVVSLSKTMADGRRQMVGLMFPSDFIGRPNVPVAPFDALAVTEVTLCLFPRPRFERLMRDIPALERRLLEITLDELDAARDWMLLLGRKTAQEKIASFLTILARRAAAAGDSGGSLRIALPITREAIGDYLGLTIETVSRQMTALRKAGVIVLEDARNIHIPDFAALLEAAGEDSDGGLIA
ncbi:Crp/Fnr family transcriptional regulator FnrL [Paralimibaculum aggregatum]|uniref:Crp/Fnr family transcriptional regulator FnrL n=1 Tax=Paralimibaculum aggregatum TaxID=3036245 RepID=A0ABQ6LS67_9RHOB|nr:helix-turn-helix domain-containing protein [Limibaculum sp. NKW23]GMG84651.1 Crp/Fnr family transcriptional regulator FnrL [Limibaculum sp. NKW23]